MAQSFTLKVRGGSLEFQQSDVQNMLAQIKIAQEWKPVPVLESEIWLSPAGVTLAESRIAKTEAIAQGYKYRTFQSLESEDYIWTLALDDNAAEFVCYQFDVIRGK